MSLQLVYDAPIEGHIHLDFHRLTTRLIILLGLTIGAAAQAQTFSPPDEQAPIDIEAYRRLHPPEVANGLTRGETVMDRDHSDYEPIGTRLGSFAVLPTLGIAQSYDDNIYRTQAAAHDDFVSEAQPNLSLKSQWNADSLNLRAVGDIARHADHPPEDWNDWRIESDGRLDILRELFVTGRGSTEDTHEDRSSPDNQNGFAPNRYRLTRGDIGADWEVGDIDFRWSGALRNYEFANNFGSAGLIDNTARNRTEYDSVWRVGYEYLPQNQIFARVSYDERSYQTQFDSFGYQRGGDGVGAAIGTDFDLGGLVTAQGYLGFLHQVFIDSRFAGVDTPLFGGRVLWEATPLMTIDVSGSRTIEETTLQGAASYLATKVRLNVEYELLRNVLINPQLGYIRDNFTGISRIDDIYFAHIAVVVPFNRSIALTVSDGYVNRQSTEPGAGYKGNSVMINLVATY